VRGVVWLAALLGLAPAASFFALRAFGGSGEPPNAAEDWLGDLGFFAVYAAPSLLAFLALRGRPNALLAAAVLSALLSRTAFSGVTLVLLLPAAAYAFAFIRLRPGSALPLLATLVTVAAGYVAFWTLFAWDDLYCWQYEKRADGTTTFRTLAADDVSYVRNGQRVFSSSGRPLKAGGDVVEAGGGCEDRITLPESIASLVLVGLAVAGAAVTMRPRPGRR
jgi:hypothetical protein